MSNELGAIVTFFMLALGVVIFFRLGRHYLFAYSAFIIVASNATVSITVSLVGFSVSLGVIIYSIVYLITDCLSEFGEKNAAYKLAVSNLLVQVIFWVYILMVLQSQPDTDGSTETFGHLTSLYSTTPQITLAALVASLGAFLDIWVYQRIKRYSEKNKVLKSLALRNNASTFIGQAVNTALFFGIALYGVVDMGQMVSIIAAAVAVKWIISLLDTPFLYLLRAIAPRQG